MEAAILNIYLTSCWFLKANKIPIINANCTDFFQIIYFQQMNQ